MKKHSIKKGGGCGCGGDKSKLFGGGARKRRTMKKRARQIAGTVNLEKYTIPLNTHLQQDPIKTSISARLSGGRKQRNLRRKRGGGILDFLQDPLLGKNPGPVTGFGSSAGTSNTLQLLAGSSYNNSGLGMADNSKAVSSGISPKV